MTTANTTAGTRQADPAGATERRLRIGIVGGTGYTGVELLRLLAASAGLPGRSLEILERHAQLCSPLAFLI